MGTAVLLRQSVHAPRRQGSASAGKAIVATSDMYLPSGFIQELLHQCGYGTLSNVFVSCEFGASKSDGHLYEKIRKRFGEAKSYVHVGDNRHSDLQEAQRHRMQAILYPNVHQQGNRFRPEDMSSITGSIYRGIVNAQMHNGLSSYSREYEYGFILSLIHILGILRPGTFFYVMKPLLVGAVPASAHHSIKHWRKKKPQQMPK